MYFKHEWRKSEWFKNLTKQEIQILFYLNNFADKDGKTDVSQTTLRKLGKLSNKFVIKWIKSLEGKNLISIIREIGKNNFYTLEFYNEPVNVVHQYTTFTGERKGNQPVNDGGVIIDEPVNDRAIEPVNVVHPNISSTSLIRRKNNNNECNIEKPTTFSNSNLSENQTEKSIIPSDPFLDYYVSQFRLIVKTEPSILANELQSLIKIKKLCTNIDQFKKAVDGMMHHTYFKEKTLTTLLNKYEIFVSYIVEAQNKHIDTSNNCNNTQWHPKNLSGIKL
jgi:hypothetical protein